MAKAEVHVYPYMGAYAGEQDCFLEIHFPRNPQMNGFRNLGGRQAFYLSYSSARKAARNLAANFLVDAIVIDHTLKKSRVKAS